VDEDIFQCALLLSLRSIFFVTKISSQKVERLDCTCLLFAFNFMFINLVSEKLMLKKVCAKNVVA
jgi:hypothetical protein